MGHRHCLGRRDQKFAKFADGRGVGVKNREKFADVLNGWSHACLQVRDKFNQAPFFDMKNLFFMKD